MSQQARNEIALPPLSHLAPGLAILNLDLYALSESHWDYCSNHCLLKHFRDEPPQGPVTESDIKDQ